MSSNTLSIILPCFNEEGAIKPVLDLLLRAKPQILQATGLNQLQILVVDDASTDASLMLLRQYSTEIEIHRHEQRRGYGAAIKTGLRFSHGLYVAFYDMDYTYDPIELICMVQVLRRDNLGMVCGNRLHEMQNMPFSRFLGNFSFRWLIRRFFGVVVEDSCTGQRVFLAKYASLLDRFLPENLNFSLAMTLFFLQFRVPFREIPIRYHRRLGRSKLRILLDGFRFYFTIVTFWLRSRLGFVQLETQAVNRLRIEEA